MRPMSDEANTSELIRRIENILRVGTIAAVNHGAKRVRIATGGLLTDWLPWLAFRAGDVRRWSPPFVGEQCMVLAPGGDTARAVAMTGLYSDDFPAPSDSPDVERTEYPDGAVIEYDHAAHRLVATLPEGGTADITAPTSVTVHSAYIELDALQTTATGNLTVEGLFTYEAGMVGTGGVGGTAAATINGSVHVSDDVTASGISLNSHTHGGVQPGGGNTAGPQ